MLQDEPNKLLLCIVDFTLVDEAGVLVPKIFELQKLIDTNDHDDGFSVVSVLGKRSSWCDRTRADSFVATCQQHNLTQKSVSMCDDDLIEDKSLQRQYLQRVFPRLTPKAMVFDPSSLLNNKPCFNEHELEQLWKDSVNKQFYLKEPRCSQGDGNFLLDASDKDYASFRILLINHLKESVVTRNVSIVGITHEVTIPLSLSDVCVLEHVIPSMGWSHRVVMSCDGNTSSISLVTSLHHPDNPNNSHLSSVRYDYIDQVRYGIDYVDCETLTETDLQRQQAVTDSVRQNFSELALDLFNQDDITRRYSKPIILSKVKSPMSFLQRADGYELLYQACEWIFGPGFGAKVKTDSIISGLLIDQNLVPTRIAMQFLLVNLSSNSIDPVEALSKLTPVYSGIKQLLLQFEHGQDAEDQVQHYLPLVLSQENCPHLFCIIEMLKVLSLLSSHETVKDQIYQDLFAALTTEPCMVFNPDRFFSWVENLKTTIADYGFDAEIKKNSFIQLDYALQIFSNKQRPLDAQITQNVSNINPASL